MHFAWKDENFLIKILTFIMIFVVLVMVAISPVFGSYNIDIEGIDDSIHSFIINDELLSFNYYAFFHFSGSDYDIVAFFGSDSPFTYSHIKNLVPSSGSYIYSWSSDMMPIHGSYDNEIQEFNNLTKSQLISTDLAGGTVTQEGTVVYNNFDIKDENGVVVNPKPFLEPSFITTDDELCSGKFDLLKIDMGDLDYDDDKIVLNIYDNFDMGNGIYSDYKKKSFMLDKDSSYRYVSNLNIYYYIPQANLGIDLSNDKRYTFELASYDDETVYDKVTFQIGGLTIDEEIKNKEDEQTEAIKENTETNKGIWETIKDILSYINPFSENFFVYKLIELLVEAIKSLFIPSDDFFSTYFTDLKDWFSDRLGFLFYPFELFIDILNKILDVDFSEPVFSIPDINEPFTNKKIISATTFNLNSLLTNSTWNTVHSIYLIIVDAFIVFGLVNLFLKKYKEVTTE